MVVGKPNEKTGELPWDFIVTKGGNPSRIGGVPIGRGKEDCGYQFHGQIEKTTSEKFSDGTSG